MKIVEQLWELLGQKLSLLFGQECVSLNDSLHFTSLHDVHFFPSFCFHLIYVLHLFIYLHPFFSSLSIYLSACMFCHAHPLFKLSQSYSIVYICMYVCMYNYFHSHVYIRTYIHLLTHLTIIHLSIHSIDRHLRVL